MPNKTIVAIAAVAAIIITALVMGHNGTLVSIGVAAIAGLGGFIAGKAKKS